MPAHSRISTKQLILNITARLLLIAVIIATGLFFVIAMGFGKSSLHAPRHAIELSQLAVGIAVVAGCILCLTPIKVLKSKAISTKLYKYLTVSLIAQPILAVPLIHHFF